ncbi:hypothetical protein L249_3925 [Ophiocordyceps polyrhachis-furcata BCC 54312]|uniref:CFEM domain-containing protein n=1 Tax=Ophiocordyceps polyrhachis-furcata BCC 54312 TaxID=1330021 RepID=A0A367L5N7_9HYPO|nr:hypothetical protein L249_3925 [Ophiocordyceps polyrhachis-furcata BCC 54312]
MIPLTNQLFIVFFFFFSLACFGAPSFVFIQSLPLQELPSHSLIDISTLASLVMRTSLVLLVASALAGQASASLLMKGQLLKQFVRAKYERKPANDKLNVCSPQQQQGWGDYQGLQPEQPVTEYGNVRLDGFVAKQDEDGPAAIGRRTLALHLQGDTSKLHGEAPSISSGDEGNGFSIKEVEVMCDPAGILTMTFVKPGGVTCRLPSRCADKKFTIVNDKCSDAVRVSFEWNRNYKLPSELLFGYKKSSQLANKAMDKFGVDYMKLYRITWDCEERKQQTLQPHPDQTFVLPSQEDVNGHTETTGTGAGETVVVHGEGTLQDSSEDITSPSTVSLQAGQSAGEAFFPSLLPSCINTCIAELGLNCQNNLDVSCFCPNEQFAQRLYSCVNANRGSEQDFVKAKEVYGGMCISHIPKNPGIVTDASTFLGSMAIEPTPCFAPSDYTTVVVPTTQIEGQGVVVTVTETISIPQIVLPTVVPGPGWFGGQSGGDSLEKPQSGSEESRPVLTALEQQPTSVPEGHQPQPGLGGFTFQQGLGEHKPESGDKLGLDAYKTDSGTKEHKPQPGTEEYKPQSGCKECAGIPNGPKAPEPQPATEEYKPQPATEGYKPQPASEEYKPQPATEGYKPQPASEEYKPQPATEGYKPQPASEEYKPQPATEGYKPQPASEEYKPQPATEGYKPQPATEEYKPQSGCQTCAGVPNGPKAPEPQPGSNPISPQSFNTAMDKGGPPSSPESYEPGTGPNPSSPQLSEPAVDKGESPASPESYESGTGPSSEPAADKGESPGSPESYEAGPGSRKSVIKLKGKPGKQGAACVPKPKGPTDSSPEASLPKEKSPEPDYGSPKLSNAGEAPKQEAPKKEAPSTPSAGKPYSPEPAGSRSVPSAGGPKSPVGPGYGDDKESAVGSPKTGKKVTQQPGPKDKPSKSSPNFNGTATKSTFGSIAVQTGGYSTPKYGNSTVNGASRAGLGLFAVVAAIAAF